MTEWTREGWRVAPPVAPEGSTDARPPRRHILVIRLGALGDFVLSFSAFAAIRAHHAADHITLLTSAALGPLARQAPWFDVVLVDRRPRWWDVAGVLALRRRLRGYDMVYDLQTSRRSNAYYRLAGEPPWSGIAPGCSAPHANPSRNGMHTLERQREQLEFAGIKGFPSPDVSWFASVAAPRPSRPYAILVPGSASHRLDKRWPAERFGRLASGMAGRGLQPVVVGSGGETVLAAQIHAECPSAIDLTGRTDLTQLGSLAAGAQLAVGNDTGPMHIAGAHGCPSVVLFGAASNPSLTAPRYPDGGWPVVIRAQVLSELAVDRVAAALPSLR